MRRRHSSPFIAILTFAAAVPAAACVQEQVGTPAGSGDAEEPPPIEAGQVPPPGPYAPGFDALHYDVALTLPDTGAYIRGAARARIALVEPRRDSLPFDLTGLAVERVRVGGREVGFRYEAGKLYAPVPAGADVGDTVTVDVDYAGTPDDGLIIGTNVHGRRTAFADNWPNRARYWFPSIDHPSDKATVAFAVSAPEPFAVIANGLRAETTPLDPPAPAEGSTAPRRTWRWATGATIPTYTMVVGAAEFAIDTVGVALCDAGAALAADRAGRAASADADAPSPAGPEPTPAARPDAADCVAVTTWVFPADTANAAPSFRRAAEMVDFYSTLVAPFPYEKLAHVQSSTRFGGMENVAAIFYAERSIAQGRDIEGTVAHETAHQWFGDAVTEADWHHLWLSEGFASYFGPLFFEHADGVERFREIMAGARRRYLESEGVERPIVDPEADDLFALLNANSYQKGAWVLHMLRGELGDDAFFEGVRRYYRAHEHGTALTEDLVLAMEQASGRELDWFFEQWVFRPGHPRLRLEHRWDAEAGAAVVTITQSQPAEWPTFRMTLDLEIETPAGAVRRDVEVAQRQVEARIPLDAPPTAVRPDPDGWILLELASS